MGSHLTRISAADPRSGSHRDRCSRAPSGARTAPREAPYFGAGVSALALPTTITARVVLAARSHSAKEVGHEVSSGAAHRGRGVECNRVRARGHTSTTSDLGRSAGQPPGHLRLVQHPGARSIRATRFTRPRAATAVAARPATWPLTAGASRPRRLSSCSTRATACTRCSTSSTPTPRPRMSRPSRPGVSPTACCCRGSSCGCASRPRPASTT